MKKEKRNMVRLGDKNKSRQERFQNRSHTNKI